MFDPSKFSSLPEEHLKQQKAVRMVKKEKSFFMGTEDPMFDILWYLKKNNKEYFIYKGTVSPFTTVVFKVDDGSAIYFRDKDYYGRKKSYDICYDFIKNSESKDKVVIINRANGYPTRKVRAEDFLNSLDNWREDLPL